MKISKAKGQKQILELVKKLFHEAKIQFNKNPELSNKYVKLARKAAMKINLRFPREYKRKFCKHCYTYLVPGKNARVRLHKSRVIYYCFNCKKYMRFNKR
ncbi:MAG: ribonuclease P [Nanoarchaeota archaeon]